MKKVIYYLMALIVPLLGGCAKMLTPVGGPKDTTPPEVIKVQPNMPAINFKDNAIKITYNEFVVLNNPLDNCIFSPPLKHTPDFSISRKSVVVQIKDTLRPNTTYNMVFADCVKDFTEGNPQAIYQYTFSTGNSIDTFSYSGTVYRAKEPAPVKNCLVFLYRDNIDSLPKSTRPDYVTKTLSDGSFVFNNIAEGEYKIFAMTDINKNLIYDLPDEEIAFSEQPVKAVPMIIKDTCSKDSVNTSKSTGKGKSTEKGKDKKKDKVYQPNDTTFAHTLWMFTEKDTNQKMLGLITPTHNTYILPYRSEINEYEIRFPDRESKPDFFEILSPTKDTLSLYFKESKKDTFKIEITVNQRNIDTLTLEPFKEKKSKGGRGNRNTGTDNRTPLVVTASNAGELFRPFILNFSHPIKPVADVPVEIIKKKKSGNDTLRTSLTVPDTFTMQLQLDFDKEEKVPYDIYIKDSIFYGYNGLTNDSLKFSFTMHSEKEYGDLIMNYRPKRFHDYIIQLLNEDKTALIQQDIINASTSLAYRHLTPGNYTIRVIEDNNGNGQWDTGNYSNKQQPEKVFYYTKTITIRGYWELEETFNF